MYSSKGLEEEASSGARAGAPPASPNAAPASPPTIPPDVLDREVLDRLAAPFPPERVRVWAYRQDGTGQHALSRLTLRVSDVRGRLDAVLGVGGYTEAYEVVDERTAVCRLTVGGVTATGAGEGGSLQDALDDAFTHAAARFGVGCGLLDVGLVHTRWRVQHELDADVKEVLEGVPGGLEPSTASPPARPPRKR